MPTATKQKGASLGRALMTIALLPALAACPSPRDRSPEFNQSLVEADGMIQEGELEAAVARLVAVIADIEAEVEDDSPFDYGVQRGVSEALLVGANMAAGRDTGFLKAPRRSTVVSLGVESEEVSESAHRLAGIYHAWRLLSLKDRVQDPEGKNGELLGRLKSLLGEGDAANFAWLNVAGAFAQLGYDEAARDFIVLVPAVKVLLESDELKVDLKLVEELDRYGVPRNLQWYLFATGHELQKRAFADSGGDPLNRTRAFRFGCLAAFGRLDAGGQHDGEVQDPEFKKEFFAWVDEVQKSEESPGRFQTLDREQFTNEPASATGVAAIDFAWSDE